MALSDILQQILGAHGGQQVQGAMAPNLGPSPLPTAPPQALPMPAPDPYQSAMGQYSHAAQLDQEAIKKKKVKKKGEGPRPGQLLAATLLQIAAGPQAHVVDNFMAGHAQARRQENDRLQEEADNEAQQLGTQAQNERQMADLTLKQQEYKDSQDLKKQALGDKTEIAKSKAYEGTYNRFTQAKTGAMVRTIGARLQKIDPEQAPTTEEIEAQANQLDAANTKGALDAWNAAQKGLQPNVFGDVGEDDAKSLEPARQIIARSYGVDPETLPPVRTGESMRKQRSDILKKQWEQKFTYGKEQDKKKWADKLANRTIAQSRLEVSRGQLQVAYQGLQLRQWDAQTRADMSSYNAKLRQYNALAKGHNKNLQDDIKKIDMEIAGMQGMLGSKTIKPEDKDAAQTKLDQLQGQKNFLMSQEQPEDPTPPLTPPEPPMAGMAPGTQPPTGMAPMKPTIGGPMGGQVSPLKGTLAPAVASPRHGGGVQHMAGVSDYGPAPDRQPVATAPQPTTPASQVRAGFKTWARGKTPAQIQRARKWFKDTYGESI